MRKKPTILIVFLILTVICLIGCGTSIALQDNIIMYYGIRSFRTLRSILIGASCLSAGGAVFGGVRFALQNKQERLEEVYNEIRQDEIKSLESKKQARLSVSDDIDPAYLKTSLNAMADGKWKCYADTIYMCVKQFVQMDSYQERFHQLLVQNGANSLGDTEDVINQVEQFMCRNVRNVVNYMTVADDDDQGRASVYEKLCKSYEENQALLGQTKDFIYAMTDFLNSQSGEADTRLLETYKDTLLKTIRKESVL